MYLSKLIVLLFVVLNSYYVRSKASDIVYLRDHFITNLLEENRDKLSLQLTDDIEKSIDLKINAFLTEINGPKERKKRLANDLLLNEKPTDVNILKGFERRGIVPVNFPQDICMFKLHGKSFAASLNHGKTVKEGTIAENFLSIFMRSNRTFVKIHEYKSKYLSKIECESVNEVGYVAVLNSVTIQMKSDELLKSGSFVYKVTFDPSNDDSVKVTKLQTFAESNQIGVSLWTRDQDLYLVYSYNTEKNSTLEKCTVFKLSSNNFNPIDSLPCQNARVIEFFTVNHNFMVLVGNYRENNGTTNAFSSILRYDLTQRRFIEHQKIYTNAITVGKYFYLDHQNQRQHFLFIGNSFEIGDYGTINYDVPSIIYKWVDGFFIPLQTVDVKHVQAVSAVLGKDNEFNLLITSEDSEVQIYYYDGWKFQESSIDFTGSAFGAGVVTIRSYSNIIENTSTIVISNTNSYGNQFNIYTPVYIKKTDASLLKENILSWCYDTHAKLDEFNVDEADELLKNAINMIDPLNENATITGDLFIKNSKIDEINANQFKRRNSLFNKGSVEKINELSVRVGKLRKDVNKLKEKIDFTKATTRIRRQAAAEDEPLVDRLIVDKLVNIKTINGKQVSDIVYQDNRRNTKMKNIKANEIGIKEDLYVNEKVDGVEMSPDNVLMNVPEQNLRPMFVEKLNVRSLDTLKINDQYFDDFFKLLRRKVDQKIPNMIHQLDVDALNVKELFNGENITDIFINSLKTVGTQFVNSNIDIQNLYTNGIIFERTLEAISKIPISHLINIKDNKPVQILQDVQFEQEVEINDLFVEERINNIKVKNTDLQVVRKRGLTEQTVTGEKHFNIVSLKEPIMLNGKIESKTLEKMNPIATIDNNLVLQGDYVIKGPVLIRRFVNATENILTSDNQYSFRKLAETGLNLFTTASTNDKINFKNVLEVRNNFNANSINGKLTETFVKTNFEAEQVISGAKTFKNSLFVSRGTVQADIINDVDLKRLNQTTLKRNSPVSQFIDGNIEFEQISVDQVISQKVNMAGKDVNLILNTKKPQNLQELSANFLKVKNMKATVMEHKIGAKIFDSDLNFLIDDSISQDSFFESLISAKSFGHLKVDHLEFVDGNEWKSIISNFNNMIVEELNVTDSYAFDNIMRIGNLQVQGTINGIKYEDMLNNWLKLESEQVFVVPQTFKYLKVSDNIASKNGLINNVEINKLIQESIWIDEPISLNSLEVTGRLGVREAVFTPLINGATFEERIILNNTIQPQRMHKIKISNKAEIHDLKYTSINSIDLEEFFNFFIGNNEGANLIISGIADLNHANISSLNNVALDELYQTAWLRNRNIKLIGDDIRFFGDVEISKLLYIDELNGKELDDVQKTYLSKTIDQHITSNLNVLGTLVAEKSLHTQKVIVPKFIKIDDHTLLNISHFETNVLRHNIDQDIIGNWKIGRLVLYGDFNGLINRVNVQTDILHAGNFHTAVVTGHKKFRSLEAHNVNTRFINDIDVIDWIENSVKTNTTEQQIINGHVTFKNTVYVTNNLQVHGTVNGIDIRPENILTKSGERQVISGDVTINNMPHETSGFKQIFIENLSLKDGINGRDWNEFHDNAFTRDSPFIDSKQIIFENELKMESILTDNSIYGTDMKEFLKGSSTNNKLMKFKDNMEYLTQVGDDLMRSLADNVVELSHFEHHQTIASKYVQNTVLFSFKHDRVTEYVLGIRGGSEREVITFYRWNPQDKLFHEDKQITPQGYNPDLFQTTQFHKIIYGGNDCLFLEVYDKRGIGTFVQVLLQYDPEIKSFKPVANMNGKESMTAFTWRDGSSPCYGSIRRSFENILINCDGKAQTVIKTRPIKNIWSENNIIVISNDEDKVQVWYEDKFYTLPTVMNPASFASAIYKNKIYLVVRSDKADQTVYRGDINIYVSPIHEMKFEHLQKLTLNIPTTVKFSKAPSGDLLLYILTRDPTKALNIYTYSGSSNFVEIIDDTTMIPDAYDLSNIQINNKVEVLSVASSDHVYVLQAALVQY
ncbi:unnamed protein product [Chironomus riparius]|uniref:Closca n=1 Tax=Chironomus riparius TaxID=315576 RepID=A0A9N9WLE4_9DIPT|nr:unnamed protein product [Chironomus riparius]